MIKIDFSQLVEKMESMSLWLLPEEEAIHRKKLIDHWIEVFSNDPIAAQYLKLKLVKPYVELSYQLAHLKPISNNMLLDYIDGLFQFLLYKAGKKFSDGKNSFNLVNPSLDILLMFVRTDQWRDYLIGEEVSGQEFQLINGMTIPFTPEEIRLHIKRMREIPVSTAGIAKVKSSLRKYNEKLYSDASSEKNEDLSNKGKKDKKHYEFDVETISKIHQVCIMSEVLTCGQLDFIIAVGYADFSQIESDTKQRMQFLIYRLSKIMVKSWYENAALSKGWTKDDCSRHGKLSETNSWASKIYKLTNGVGKP